MEQKKRKIAICAAFEPGQEIIDFCLAQPFPLEFVATCAQDKSPFEAKIAEACERAGIPIYRHVDVNTPAFRSQLREHQIDLMILGWWPAIVKKESIECVRLGWVNLHPSLLPYNRGKHPYYWSIVEGTPFGATLHFIESGVDSGPILFQKKVPVTPIDTGATLYNKGVRATLDLFKESYTKIATGQFQAVPQEESTATFHWKRQIEEHSEIQLEKSYPARDLLNILRARSFPTGDSAFFYEGGVKYRVRLSIERASDP